MVDGKHRVLIETLWNVNEQEQILSALPCCSAGFNRNIVECKFRRHDNVVRHLPRSFNRNIVECKVYRTILSVGLNCAGFNRNIVECKVKRAG